MYHVGWVYIWYIYIQIYCWVLPKLKAYFQKSLQIHLVSLGSPREEPGRILPCEVQEGWALPATCHRAKCWGPRPETFFHRPSCSLVCNLRIYYNTRWSYTQELYRKPLSQQLVFRTDNMNWICIYIYIIYKLILVKPQNPEPLYTILAAMPRGGWAKTRACNKLLSQSALASPGQSGQSRLQVPLCMS